MQYVSLYAQYQGDLFPGATADYQNYIEIDQYDYEPIKISMSVQSVEEPTATTSSYTQNFKVPHTSINGRYFKAVFNVNSTDYDATQKAQAYITVNGAYFVSGNIRLNSIIINPATNKIEYEIGFFGETSTFASVVGPSNLSQLNLNHLTHPLTYANLTNSWNPGGLLNGDIVYPLAEYGYTYGTSGPTEGQPLQNTLSVWNGTTSKRGFTNSQYPLALDQFQPAIRLKAIWDAVFDGAGFTYESDFLEGSWFKNLYMISTNVSSPLLNSKINANVNFRQNQRIGIIGVNTVEPTKLLLSSIITDTANATNLANSTYVVPYTGTYTFKLFLNASFDKANDFFFNWLVGYTSATVWIADANGLTDYAIATVTSYVTFQSGATSFNSGPMRSVVGGVQVDYIQFTISVNAGDRLIFTLSPSLTYFENLQITSGTFTVVGPLVVAPAGLLPTQYKQLDFIKAVNDRFKLMWEPDKNVPNKFNITPWVDWVKSGRQIDWTGKLNGNQAMNIKPLFATQSRRVIFSDSEEADIYNFSYQQQYKQTFGQLNQDSNIEVITGDKEIKSLFAPMPLAPIGLAENFLIPHFAKDTETQRQPIQVKPRIGFYNGLQTPPYAWYASNVPWFEGMSGAASYVQTKYPAFSSFDRFPYDSNAVDINWTNPPQFWTLGGTAGSIMLPDFDGRTPNTAYTNYWKTWFENTYDPYSRVMEGTFALDSKDVTELKFNDFIFIKDSWWQPIEVKDFVIGQKQNTKVKLIKLGAIGVNLDNPTAGTKYYQFPKLCYGPTGACQAACCIDPNEYSLFTTTPTLGSATIFYANGTGSIFANAGFYSDGTTVYQVGNFGSLVGTTLVSACDCSIGGLYPFTVAGSSTGCATCCATTRPLTIYADSTSFGSSSNLYADNVGTPLTANFFYGFTGPTGGTLQVGSDGHTTTLAYNCESCGCNDFTFNGVRSLADNRRAACCVSGVTGSDGIFTMYQDVSAFDASEFFYYDPAGSAVVPDPVGFTGGTGFVTGSTGFISDGTNVHYVIGGTSSSVVACNYTTEPCANRNQPVRIRTQVNTSPFSATVKYEWQISFDNINWFANNTYNYSGTSTIQVESPFAPNAYVRIKFTVTSSNRVQLILYRNGSNISTTYYDTPGGATTYFSPSFGTIGTGNGWDFYFFYNLPEL